MVVAYKSELSLISATLAKYKGANVILWLISKEEAPLNVPGELSTFDAVTGPTAEKYAKKLYKNKLKEKLFC